MNNAIKYVKVLESTGISREQAEAHVQVLAEFLESDLATKQDLENSFKRLDDKIHTSTVRLDNKIDTAVARLDSKIDTLFSQLDNKIDNSVVHIENRILQSEYRMTIKLGSIITIGLAAMTAVIKIL